MTYLALKHVRPIALPRVTWTALLLITVPFALISLFLSLVLTTLFLALGVYIDVLPGNDSR